MIKITTLLTIFTLALLNQVYEQQTSYLNGVLCKQNKHITMIATLLLLLSCVDWHL